MALGKSSSPIFNARRQSMGLAIAAYSHSTILSCSRTIKSATSSSMRQDDFGRLSAQIKFATTAPRIVPDRQIATTKFATTCLATCIARQSASAPRADSHAVTYFAAQPGRRQSSLPSCAKWSQLSQIPNRPSCSRASFILVDLAAARALPFGAISLQEQPELSLPTSRTHQVRPHHRTSRCTHILGPVEGLR